MLIRNYPYVDYRPLTNSWDVIHPSIRRIIHPIGQGAFYSEHIRDDYGNEINVVYDCGCEPQPQWRNALSREIKTLPIHNGKIDILFISHFDEDHVSNLRELGDTYTIKKIVLPVFRKEKWLEIVEIGISNYRNYNLLRQYIEREGIHVIQVNPTDLFDQQLDNTYGINNIRTNTINSGTSIIASHSPIYWIYVPLYLDNLSKYKKRLKSALEGIYYKEEKRNLTINDIESKVDKLPKYIISQINRAYAKVICKSKSSNRSSLLCFSGPAKKEDMICKLKYGNQVIDKPYKAGCLYSGDGTIKRTQCDDIAKVLKQKFIEQIGTFQLPHHGSKYNFTLSSTESHLNIDFREMVCFASNGIDNRHNHPSTSIIDGITKAGGSFFNVNELKDTELEEFITKSNSLLDNKYILF